jgi:hypothetical protein
VRLIAKNSIAGKYPIYRVVKGMIKKDVPNALYIRQL